MKRILFIFLCTICMSLQLVAGPARKGILKLRQPDGTTVEAIQSGDEFFHVLTDLSGHALIMDDSGYFCYAKYEADGTIVSTGHVAGAAAPAKVLAASSAIPYALLEARAAEKRALVNEQRAELAATTPVPFKAQSETATDNHVSKKCVVVLANFSDTTMRYTQRNFEDVFNKKGNSFEQHKGSVHDYFSDQFGDDWDFEFFVTPIVTLPQTQAYYGNNKDDNSYQAVIDACKLADEYVDFSKFDGNNDGKVDNVMVILAGTDESESGNDNAIWAHQYYLKYRTRILPVLDGVRIDCYNLCAELSLRNYTRFRIGTIGVYCHEYGHTFGLADMYDVDGDTGGRSEALNYSTGIMDCGLYNDDSRTPAHYSAVDYDTLGYGDCEELQVGSYNLAPITQAVKYYKVSAPTEGEYYLIECRKEEGWDGYIDGKGLAIYHIDRSDQDAGGVKAKDRWPYNSVNNYKAHQCADMIEPDTESPVASRAFFPWIDLVTRKVKTDSFTPVTTPSFEFWDGTPSHLSITDIKIESDGSVSFNVKSSSDLIKPVITEYQQFAYQNSARITVKCSLTTAKSYASVIWGEKGKEQKEEIVSHDADGVYDLNLEDLTPGTEYTFKTQVILSAGFASDIIEKTVATYPLDAHGEPYIFMDCVKQNSDGSFNAGTKFPLVVFNTNNVEDIRWYLDDTPIYLGKDGFYTMKKSGTLKAVIRYTNGQKETIKKQLTVK